MDSELVRLLVEFVGTFIFLSVIVGTGQAMPIAIALLAVIYFGGAVSGGHFNPAVTVMKFANKEMSNSAALGYIGAQVLGGLAAMWVYKNLFRPTVQSGSSR